MYVLTHYKLQIITKHQILSVQSSSVIQWDELMEKCVCVSTPLGAVCPW